MKVSSLRNSFEVLFVLSLMDLKLKYQSSVLGFFWSFIKPLLQFLVYLIIFKYIIKINTDESFTLKLFFGVLIWAWFAEGTSLGLNAFLGKRSIITKVKINKLMPPVAAYLTQTVNYFLNFSVFLVTYLLFAKSFPENMFTLSNLLIVVVSFTSISLLILSLNLILANLNALYRDIQPIWELVLMYGIFLTPIIYQIPIPHNAEALYYSINLIALPITNLKSVFFTTQPRIDDPMILLSYFCSLFLLCFCAYWVHKKLSYKAVDFL